MLETEKDWRYLRCDMEKKHPTKIMMVRYNSAGTWFHTPGKGWALYEPDHPELPRLHAELKAQEDKDGEEAPNLASAQRQLAEQQDVSLPETQVDEEDLAGGAEECGDEELNETQLPEDECGDAKLNETPLPEHEERGDEELNETQPEHEERGDDEELNETQLLEHEGHKQLVDEDKLWENAATVDEAYKMTQELSWREATQDMEQWQQPPAAENAGYFEEEWPAADNVDYAAREWPAAENVGYSKCVAAENIDYVAKEWPATENVGCLEWPAAENFYYSANQWPAAENVDYLAEYVGSSQELEWAAAGNVAYEWPAAGNVAAKEWQAEDAVGYLEEPPAADNVGYLEEPAADNACYLEEELPAADNACYWEEELPLEEELPAADIACYLEEELPAADNACYLEEELPAADNAWYLEEELPAADNACYLEEELPAADNACYLEEEPAAKKVCISEDAQKWQETFKQEENTEGAGRWWAADNEQTRSWPDNKRHQGEEWPGGEGGDEAPDARDAVMKERGLDLEWPWYGPREDWPEQLNEEGLEVEAAFESLGWRAGFGGSLNFAPCFTNLRLRPPPNLALVISVGCPKLRFLAPPNLALSAQKLGFGSSKPCFRRPKLGFWPPKPCLGWFVVSNVIARGFNKRIDLRGCAGSMVAGPEVAKQQHAERQCQSRVLTAIAWHIFFSETTAANMLQNIAA